MWGKVVVVVAAVGVAAWLRAQDVCRDAPDGRHERGIETSRSADGRTLVIQQRCAWCGHLTRTGWRVPLIRWS